jgi:hypothetical protein
MWLAGWLCHCTGMMMMPLPPLLLLLAVTTDPVAAVDPMFTGPAFADGPYNSVLGALGSGDKALISQEGVLTRLYRSPGAQGSAPVRTQELPGLRPSTSSPLCMLIDDCGFMLRSGPRDRAHWRRRQSIARGCRGDAARRGDGGVRCEQPERAGVACIADLP